MHMKLQPMSVRLEPEIRDALERAALEERRTLSAMIDVLLVRGLRDMGYLPPLVRHAEDDRHKAGKSKKP